MQTLPVTFSDEAAPATETARKTRQPLGEQLVDTILVLAALAGVILAGFIVGCKPGELLPSHPVWRVIFCLASLGMVSSYTRILQLLKERNSVIGWN